MRFKEVKRIKDPDQRKTFMELSKDILYSNIPLEQIVEKYKIKMVNKVAQHNIAYTNQTCRRVSQNVRELLGRGDDYEVGEILTCRKRCQSKNRSFSTYVNFEYKIINVSADSLRLLDEDTQTEFSIPRRIVDTHFVYGYCSTVHSMQGSSIDGKYVIFEWNHRYVSRKWLYVALSRSTNLNNIYLFKDKPEEIDDQLVKKYFLNKIENYKKQDKNKKFEIHENYIDIDWLKKCIGKSCGSCGCQLELEVVNGKVQSNITADRIYNTSPYSKDNIRPC